MVDSAITHLLYSKIHSNHLAIGYKYIYTPMKPYVKENRRGILRDIRPRAREYIFSLMFDIPSRDQSPHGKLFASSLLPGELKLSPRRDINPLYHPYTRCIAHIYSHSPSCCGEYICTIQLLGPYCIYKTDPEEEVIYNMI